MKEPKSAAEKEGNLVIKTSVNEVTEMAPYAYQMREGKAVEVPCKYRLEGQTLSYEFPEAYDKNLELVIYSSSVFSSFTGSSLDNWGFTATYDDSGNLYGGGIAFDGWGSYPTTTGAFDVTQNGNFYVAITKFSPTGNTLIYSTYIGGNNERSASQYDSGSKWRFAYYGAYQFCQFPYFLNRILIGLRMGIMIFMF